MPHVVAEYRKNGRDYLEVCPLQRHDAHEVGPVRHELLEFPKDQDRDAFIAEALAAVAHRHA